MNTQSQTPSAPSSSVAEIPSEAVREHEMHDVEALTNELKRLLVKHEKTLSDEGIRHEVELLERWMESYRRGLAAAGKISTTGMHWLEDLRNHLKLAAEELHRLESEGGAPPSKEQAEKTEELLKAMQRIEKVMPDLIQIFGHGDIKAAAERQHEPA